MHLFCLSHFRFERGLPLRSNERARELGEVFTNEREVKAMLDLVKDVNFASRYLEPGCGSGNFLVEILARKFDLLTKLPEVKSGLENGNLHEFHLKLITALGSLYGIDIDPHNVEESQKRVLYLTLELYNKASRGAEMPISVKRAIEYVIHNNIVLGDMISAPEGIEIYEYAELPGHKVKIRVFKYSDLLYPEDEVFDDTPRLFGHVPQPVREIPLMHFEEIGSNV